MIWRLGDPEEDGFHKPRDQPFVLAVIDVRAHTRKGLSARGLTVSEDCAVYALEDAEQSALAYLSNRSLATLWNTYSCVLSPEKTRSNVKRDWLAEPMAPVSFSLMLS